MPGAASAGDALRSTTHRAAWHSGSLSASSERRVCALFPAMFKSVASSVFSTELNAWKYASIGEIVPPAFCETFSYE